MADEINTNPREEEFEKLPRSTNILVGQEGPIRRPIFEGEFGHDQKFLGYEILDVRVKSVYCKEDQLWVKFERLDGTDGFNVRIDNAYNQFKNTKEMTQDEIDRAEWMKARNKLDSPQYVQKMIHNAKDINALVSAAGYNQGKQLSKDSDISLEETTQSTSKEKSKTTSHKKEKVQENNQTLAI